jgi:hypothetical protein
VSVEFTGDLGRVFVAMLNEFRPRDVVSDTPGGVDRAGRRRLTVPVKNRNVTIRARPGCLAQ